MKCQHCGYERNPLDPPPATECPNCGLRYDGKDSEADVIRKNLERIKRSEAARPKAEIQRQRPEKLKPSNKPKAARITEASPALDEWKDIAAFRQMVTPSAIKIVFWMGMVVLVIAAFTAMYQKQMLIGLATLFIAPFVWRQVVEMIILPFSIHESLEAIRKLLEAQERRSRSQVNIDEK